MSNRQLLLTFVTLLAACSKPAARSSALQATVAAPGWCHAALQSTAQVALRFDYQVVDHRVDPTSSGTADTQTAAPAWLNVTAASLTGHEAVRVVAISKGYSSRAGISWGSYFDEQDRSLDLRYDAAAQKFTAQIAGGLPLSHYDAGSDDAALYFYEFAVVIDGLWQVDPVSGTSNFRVVPAGINAAGCQAG